MRPQIINIETFLPVFPGFYDTIFEANIENELYYQNQERDSYLPPIEWDDIDFDNENYENDVVEQCCSFIEYELKEFVTSVKFQSVSSPMEYNFANDSGNIEIGLTKKNIKAIKQYIIDNETAYREYLSKTYSSYDGFISWYSNEVGDWYEYTNNFTDFSQKKHYLGSVLEFICQNESITYESMYYSIETCSSSYCKDMSNKVKCEECGEWYEVVDVPEHREYEAMLDKQLFIWKVTQTIEMPTPKSFGEVYPEFSYKCNMCKL